MNKQVADIRRPFEQKLFETKLAKVPEPIRADTKAALNTPEKKRNPVQKYLAVKLGPLLKVTAAEVDKALDQTARNQTAERRRLIAELQVTKRSYQPIQALWEFAPPPPNYLYRRGDFTTPGAEVQPGIIAVLDDPGNPFQLPPAKPGSPTSGYRSALARWLTKPDHPLTARVIVNRVWQQSFGRGIVATSEDFGTAGSPPTHPKLLDWLATEFVRSGWSFKHLHRLIVSSTAYRQSSQQSFNRAPAGRDLRPQPKRPGRSKRPGRWSALSQRFTNALPDQPTVGARSRLNDPNEIDPENRLLWRMPLRRLESEIIRDNVLAVSGALDRRPGGPPVHLKPKPDGSVEIDETKLRTPTGKFRRSAYLFARRNYQLTEMIVFDQPSMPLNCTRRESSSVVLQSLTMMNGKFIFEQSDRFASRVIKAAGTDEGKRIETAFRLALARKPTLEEIEISRQLLQTQTARYAAQKKLKPQQATNAALSNLCQMLLNTNEFLYVERKPRFKHSNNSSLPLPGRQGGIAKALPSPGPLPEGEGDVAMSNGADIRRPR